MSRDLLSETITATKDIGEVQNQSRIARYDARHGLYIIEFSVPGLMNREGQVTDLDAGTYYIKAPQGVATAHVNSWDNLFIPAGTIITKVWTHTHVAVAGVTHTITPYIGSDALTAIYAVGVNDDTAELAANLIAADADVKLVVDTNPVTAGAATIFLEYYIGNVG